jgi:hypothetical protein
VLDALGVALGSAESVGVGVVVISIGVGTGGIVSGGSGSVVTADDGIDVGMVVTGGVLDAGVAEVVGGSGVAVGADDEVRPGRGGRDEYRTVVIGVVVSACLGAAPSAPSPPGTPTAAGCFAGVARLQPIVTAIGRPNATSPIKTDLGDNCTL